MGNAMLMRGAFCFPPPRLFCCGCDFPGTFPGTVPESELSPPSASERAQDSAEGKIASGPGEARSAALTAARGDDECTSDGAEETGVVDADAEVGDDNISSPHQALSVGNRGDGGQGEEEDKDKDGDGASDDRQEDYSSLALQHAEEPSLTTLHAEEPSSSALQHAEEPVSSTAMHPPERGAAAGHEEEEDADAVFNEARAGGDQESADGGSSGSGGGDGCGGGAGADSEFDEVLASYLEGHFGEAGGSLLVPLGALRLLR